MKCVKKVGGSKIVRVSDEKAHEMVSTGSYAFCPKSEWKKERTKE